MNPANLRIAIIGGGPGGLCTAIALHRKGFKNITVFERDQNTEARKQGYSFTLFAPKGGLAFLQQQGLYEEVEPHACKVSFKIMDGDTNDTLIEISKLQRGTAHSDARRVMRGGLRNTLVKVCQREGIPIKWNTKLLSYEESENTVTLKFENDTPFEVDLLIAADGLHSKVRDQLVGDPEVYSGLTATFGLLLKSECPELFENPIINKSGGLFPGINRGFFFMHHSTQHNDELYWCLGLSVPEGQVRKETGEDPTKLKQLALQKVEGWVLPTKIVSSTPLSGIHFILEFKDKEPLKINSATGRAVESKTKRITLVGDAAHPMLPFQGAGCNNALIDVENLCEELGKLLSLKEVTTQDIDKALSIYEKDMTKRGSQAVLTARSAGKDMHSPNQWKHTKRKIVFKVLSFFMNASSNPAFKLVALGGLVLLIAWSFVFCNVK